MQSEELWSLVKSHCEHTFLQVWLCQAWYWEIKTQSLTSETGNAGSSMSLQIQKWLKAKSISCYTHIYKIVANHPTYILWNARSWTKLGISSESGCFGEFTQGQETTLPSWTILEDVQYSLQIHFGFTSGGISGKEPINKRGCFCSPSSSTTEKLY